MSCPKSSDPVSPINGETTDRPIISEDHFFPEIIDPRTGRVLVSVEAGELMLTSLSKQAGRQGVFGDSLSNS
jgi:phenylacetate-coenzyme A ligase PaaK-like adenylate-forming protein